MADEPHVIRAIDWRQVFGWVNIFRAFRIAIHPSKLLLGVALLVLLYAGGRFLDWVWPANHLVVPGEIALWQRSAESAEPAKAFDTARRNARQRIEQSYANLLTGWEGAPAKDREEALAAARKGQYLGQIKARILSQRDSAVAKINKQWDEVDSQKTGEERRTAQQARDTAIASAYSAAAEAWESASEIRGRGVFITFLEYESAQVNNVMWGVVGGEWLGPNGVVGSTINFIATGPGWLLGAHPWYFVIWGIWFLVVWAIFGGAIARIAALHVARDEKLSMRQSLAFSATKTLSFIFAPLIPLLIILVIGLVITLVALLGNIPWIGPILVGVPFVLALAAGFVMTLMLVGTVGGFNLMYPTIAVEGSDSFDAISRSFSYIYARPWRMLFYTAIAVGYGALCYLFVRIFIYLILLMTHGFTNLGLFAHAAPGVPLWPTMWPTPNFLSMPYDVGFLSLNSGGDIGAWFVALWVYLLIALMGAFVISFYFSANTIIYYLMRREVDATELEDVYRDEADEEFVETAPMTPPAAATEAAPTTDAGTDATPAHEASPATATDAGEPPSSSTETPAESLDPSVSTPQPEASNEAPQAPPGDTPPHQEHPQAEEPKDNPPA